MTCFPAGGAPPSIDDYRALVRGGTPLGLGLPLVNQIAQAHGGRLLLTQREGGGSVLHLCSGAFAAYARG